MLCLCATFLAHGSLCAQKSPLALNPNRIEKPLLFAALPEASEIGADVIRQLLGAAENEQINIQLSSQLHIKGQIVAKNQQIPGTFSINIRAENYHNALFNLTVRLLADNTLSYQGRILHPRYGDALVLTRENNRYYFRKRPLKLYMPE
jgi:hypothetical protein